ncbi:MAG: hypothetical protein NT059_11150 [Planctomycetota bacterium]|nr:hypothetical protein [Planctomycetota bacterium]
MHSAIVIADAISPVLESFGRLHPLLVHLPLGLVFAAFAVEVTRLIQRRPTVSAFTPIALGLAALGAVAASGTGWFFAESEASSDSLFWHRWLGISASIVLIALAWLAARATRSSGEGAQITPIVRSVLLASALLVGWVGHLGGDMVWGENYVLQPILKAWMGAPTKDDTGAKEGAGTGTEPDKLAYYTSNVLPILQDRCYQCHGNGKHKGSLSMDVRSSLVSRDSRGSWIVQAGDPAHSLMIERCMLPAEDDDAMPPKGDRLKASQLEVLRTWIAAGAVMPAGSATGEASEVGGVRGAPVPASTAENRGPVKVAKGRSAGLPALSDSQVAEAAALRGNGINAVPLSIGASTFAVSIPGGKGVGDVALAALIPIAPQIEELSFARAAVSDAGMMQMPSMPLVRSVRVDNTALTDVGITVLLSRTLEAETVNLVSTSATDGVFMVLAKLPRLQRVYVFNTQITAQGIDRFRATHPGVEIVVGAAVPGTAGTAGPPVGP